LFLRFAPISPALDYISLSQAEKLASRELKSADIVNTVPLIAINLCLREDKYARLLENYKELKGGCNKKPS